MRKGAWAVVLLVVWLIAGGSAWLMSVDSEKSAIAAVERLNGVIIRDDKSERRKALPACRISSAVFARR